MKLIFESNFSHSVHMDWIYVSSINWLSSVTCWFTCCLLFPSNRNWSKSRLYPMYSTNVITSIHYTFNIFWTLNFVFNKNWINSSIFQIFATASSHNFLHVEAIQFEEDVIKKCWIQQLNTKGTLCLQFLKENILKISYNGMNRNVFCSNIC